MSCTGFTGSLTIPNSVTEIGDHAFHKCNGFNGSLTIGNSVTNIGEHAFSFCRGFTGPLTIGNSVTNIGNYTFKYCTTLMGSLTIPNSVTKIGKSAFHYCPMLNGSLTIGNSVTEIGDSAFYKCTYLKGSLSIPNSVTKIGVVAFQDCTGFTGSLTLGNSVTEIGDGAFLRCSRFTGSLTIPSSVTSIGDIAFSGCMGITSLNLLPLRIKEIGAGAFKLSNCKDIYCEATSPLSTCGYSFDTWNYNNSTLHVPDEAIEAYKTTGEWSKFKHIKPAGVVEATKVTINVSDMTLLVGQSDKLTATVEPDNTTYPDIAWSSDNEAIATVDADGNVTAVSVGVANITAACGSVSATCKVTVNPVPASAVTINVSDITLLVGQSDKLTANVEPANTTYPEIVWRSDNEAVATVDAEGNVTAISVGVANITATCGSVSATCKVTVNPVPASGVTINVSDITLLVGQSDQLTANVEPANTTYPEIAWSSDNEAVATVDANGVVTAIAKGVATITATCGSVSATCTVTVNSRPETPRELLRKGNGSSCTFIAMMGLSDPELSAQGYNFVFGYMDAQAISKVIANTTARYCHTNAAVYNNPQNDFWVIAYWTDESGETVWSQRRHLDGTVDDDFNFSDIISSNALSISGPDNWIRPIANGIHITMESENAATLTVYTISGQKVIERHFNANEFVLEQITGEQLLPDNYIVTIVSGKESVTKKISIR